MADPSPDTFIVRILGPGALPVGVGALVGPRQILTCAHVVNAALGLDPAVPGEGYVVLVPDGYKLDGDAGDHLWWATKLCRFAPGELDPYVPGLRRLPAEAPILPLPAARVAPP